MSSEGPAPVLATAGHVDHGKSTLVHALTGMDPDRLALEKERGLTLDLGFAWAELPSGGRVAFVDVPGHRRYVGNALAGLGAAQAVLLVVSAAEGWCAQTTEHADAAAGFGVREGIVVVTQSDRAAPDAALADVARRTAGTPLAGWPRLAVSATVGVGLPELRSALDRLRGRLLDPPDAGRLRLWVDRSFTIAGAGTVVTGTLGSGTIRVGDALDLWSARGRIPVRVRGLQTLGAEADAVAAPARVAVNLRGVAAAEVRRGDSLLTPDAWQPSAVVDVRVDAARSGTLIAHLGSALAEVALRPLDDRHVRLRLARPWPVAIGDRLVLRAPGGAGVVMGAVVLDADPPPLGRGLRRAARAAALASRGSVPDLAAELDRRGWLRDADARRLFGPGVRLEGHRVGDLVVAPDQWLRWRERLGALAAAPEARAGDGWSTGAVARALGLPHASLVGPLAVGAGVEVAGGFLLPITRGPADRALGLLAERFASEPFAAPERHELDAAGLTPSVLAAAARAGRVLVVGESVVLPPDAVARAVGRLAALPQPFSASQARQALATTRRVALPLLEHLDALGLTRRQEGGSRVVIAATAEATTAT